MPNKYWNDQVANSREGKTKPKERTFDKKMTADIPYTKVSKEKLPVKNPSGMNFQENSPDA